MNIFPQAIVAVVVVLLLRKSLQTPKKLPEWDVLLRFFWVFALGWALLISTLQLQWLAPLFKPIAFGVILYTLFQLRENRTALLYGVALFPFLAIWLFDSAASAIIPKIIEKQRYWLDSAREFTELWMLGFGVYAYVQNDRERKFRLKEEAQLQQAEARKKELEHLVQARTTELMQQKTVLENTLANLKAAQDQLIQSEKMASLGELTAGIAHEIQNPLNFVNNFAELSVDLARELREELARETPDAGLVADLMSDLVQNQEKINHHGKRAASIVSGMLQHSRTGSGKKEPTDLNALADEYLRLAFHGLRAKDKSFNAGMEARLDPAVGLVDAVPQDLGRVLLNLINNAFYAVNERKKNLPGGPVASNYEPKVTVSTRKRPDGGVEIRVADNGTGIPETLKAKIFQPFFTTKPTGQGTGLGLSLAYDIVTKGHGGAFDLRSKEGEGTEFTITLPPATPA